jgi:putative ABC transport system permease protein
MFDLDKFQEIWHTISRNKTRSLLTAFGVFWGMFMFIGMLGIGQGFENGLKSKLSNVATNSMFLFARTTSIEYKGFNAGRRWEMTQDDINLLKKHIPEIEHITGTVWVGTPKAVVMDKSADVTVQGIDQIFYEVDNQDIISGRRISNLDVVEKRKVCVMGNKTSEQLFTAGENPVGQMVKVGAVYYTIIGIVKPRGNISLGGDPGATVYIPSTTAQQIRGGTTIDFIAITVGEKVKIKNIETKVKDLLRSKHLISPMDNNALMVFNLQDMFLMFYYLFLGIAILIWIVGLGTLFAGVVGISNIMLVTVKERTNEIGIKRALGAKPKVITRQIMMESVLITFMAGFMGMFFGILVLVLVEQVTQNSESMFTNPTISFTMALVGIVIIILSGLVAGIIPAKNAMKIKAIDAIRDE